MPARVVSLGRCVFYAILAAGVGAMLVSGVIGGGCSSAPRPPRLAPDAPVRFDPDGTAEAVVVGDWWDLDAAVRLALTRAELAIESRPVTERDRRVYELVSILDEPGVLEILREPAPEGSPESWSTIRVRCRVGRFGESARGGIMADAVAQRLEQLRGLRAAPVRWR